LIDAVDDHLDPDALDLDLGRRFAGDDLETQAPFGLDLQPDLDQLAQTGRFEFAETGRQGDATLSSGFYKPCSRPRRCCWRLDSFSAASASDERTAVQKPPAPRAQGAAGRRVRPSTSSSIASPPKRN
jgi:hypothetical protein